ncbi:DUF2497 domain-containing protein [Hansschlegelia quercus]|uniref:DUF2497 domain-containing protein n=2 Tax=Hansschlegelia quercus TaxID=2528245 RepID=A0A4Q9GIX4_9HYPH|nr:DUF2497 domain-containing protein [Hansschlegelia quercus]TBN54209.1 DUF2497 domain-containing protein [Hansschlegelia quercus]
MSTAAKAHEPTMEEILASIRRIISDDEPGQSMAPKPSTAKAAEPEAAPEVDAIDAAEALGQDDIDAMFASFDAPEPPKAKAPEPAPAERAPIVPAPAAPAAEDDIDVFELTEDMAEAPFSPPPPPQPAPVARAPEPAARQEPEPRWEAPAPAPSYASAIEDRLLSNATNDAVTGAFGALTNTILANNARTLDDIVKDMLRPMLRAWLDDNLPPLVERLVKQEIERVARGGR